MSRRILYMLSALVAGTLFSVGIDRGIAPAQPARAADSAWVPTNSAPDPSLGIKREAGGRAADQPASVPRANAEPEVKTAQVSEFAIEKYTDGQAPASQVAAPPAAVASSAVAASPTVASPVVAATAVVPAGPDPAVTTAEAVGEPAPTSLHPTVAVPHEPVPQQVFTDYRAAMKLAAEDGKLLFIYFHERWPNAAQRAFETLTLADNVIKEKLKRYVLLRLPRDAAITINGKRTRILDHPAFAEMMGRQGVAIIDLAHPRDEYYGHVVSTFPFTHGKYYRKEALSIILDLPPGTLTQRTMIYAVRIHPESPASTQGIFHTALADEAKEHADYQAQILVQGHHSWESRFHRINAKLPDGVVAKEVVAESWPNEGLVEACVDCVHSWRQSPGHWGAVRGRHPLFGYDIKRGRNGIWYATGIFGHRFGRN
ncbi:MAG: hypothetical protein AB7O59_12180 [Pirellulales bacterium]